jgi:hypothetical protein
MMQAAGGRKHGGAAAPLTGALHGQCIVPSSLPALDPALDSKRMPDSIVSLARPEASGLRQ